MRNILLMGLGVLVATGCEGISSRPLDPNRSFIDPSELAALDTSRQPKAVSAAPADESGMKATQAPVLPAALQLSAAPAVTSAEKREVIYTASFRAVVADIAGSLRVIREHAERSGGYMAEISGDSITVRVPAERFHEAVSFVERVGEIIDRQVRALDVTDELRDLRTHIDNYEKLRVRLGELLAKANTIEDALKIEAQLTRITEELDRSKGRLRSLESQVAMSSIRVALNSPLPQNSRGAGTQLPFDWVSELGSGLVEGRMKQNVRKSGIFGRGPRFKPPQQFVRYYEDDDHVEAMDADELRLRVLRRENVDKAALSFWSAHVRRSLVENASLAVSNEEVGKDFYLLRGRRDAGGKTLGYVLALKRNDRRVVVFEAWGPLEAIDQNHESLSASALSIDPG